jgi:hypothetical protein
MGSPTGGFAFAFAINYQFSAFIEREFPDIRNANRYDDACQAYAFPKCVIPDFRNAVRYFNIRQFRTTGKGVIAD